MSSLLKSSINAVTSIHNPSPFELVWSSHPRWPLSLVSSDGPQHSPIQISCLDSSFNPPTTAHRAMATAPLPLPSSSSHVPARAEYDAHLLLLSVKNVEKVLGSGDATYEQRLRMMIMLAENMQQTAGLSNVAVGILAEPAFVRKDKIVRTYLKTRLSSSSSVQLAWLIGTDTLVRFFDQKFYDLPLREAITPFFSPLNHPASFLVHFPRTPAPPPSVTVDNSIASSFPSSSIRDAQMQDGRDCNSISSTVVRRAISHGKDQMDTARWVDLVPGEGIARFIEDQRLYR